jgi:hypothetical protein
MSGMERGDPISYLVLEEGTPVLDAAGREVGTVKRVLADADADVFDGIVVDTDGEDGFADAEDIGAIYERAVVLKVDGATMGEAEPNPAVIDVNPAEEMDDRTGTRVEDAVRRVRDWLTGNY